MTLQRVRILSPNYSSRGGSRVTTIVLHTAQGALTYQALGNYFKNPSSQVSSHVGIDDTVNVVGEYVDRNQKAWTAASANPWSVQAELCAFAEWTPAQWNTHQAMLQNTAQWIKEEAAIFGIPIRKLSNTDAQNPNVAGVCQHSNLGSMGGNHWDCGPSFPIDYVLQLAQGQAPTPIPPQPELEPEEVEMIILQSQTKGSCLSDGVRKVAIVSMADGQAFTKAGVKTAPVSDKQFDTFPWWDTPTK